ncbi:hypothetical protein PIB30_095457, partial [Stylosanthes scabra]|nr:hypothetical protein [Stylosanthes scabra]
TGHHHPRQSASLLRSLVTALRPISSPSQQCRCSVIPAKSSVAVFKLVAGSAVLTADVVSDDNMFFSFFFSENQSKGPRVPTHSSPPNSDGNRSLLFSLNLLY